MVGKCLAYSLAQLLIWTKLADYLVLNEVSKYFNCFFYILEYKTEN